MEHKIAERRVMGKAFRRARRRTCGPWRGLAIGLLVLAFMGFFNIPLFMPSGSRTPVNENTNVNHFQAGSAAEEEPALRQELETNGSVVLMNNGALPLAAGSRVSTLSAHSVHLAFGGAEEERTDLKTALEQSGLVVNPTLWDWYEHENSPAELPMDSYPDAVKESFAAYGDAVIVTLTRAPGEGYAPESESYYNYLTLEQDEMAMMQWAADLKAAGTISRIIVLLNADNALQADFLTENPYDVDACLWIGTSAAAEDALADQVQTSQPRSTSVVKILQWPCLILALPCLALWYKGYVELRKTNEYWAWQAFRKFPK